LAEQTHYRSGAVFALVARLFHHIVAGNAQDAAATLTEITARTDQIGVYRFWTQIGHWWLAAAGMDGELPTDSQTPAGTDWLGGAGAAQRRWCDALARRIQT
jgi:hypothetical protein